MLSLTGSVGAQSPSARLSGTVWDPSDNPTPSVIIMAVEEETGWQSEAVSDENGRYQFLTLRPGFYTVFTKAKGYQQITRRHINLPVNGSITESFTLDIAASDETLDIEEQVQVDDSDISGDITSRDLHSLPVFSRNPLLLAAHFPGIQTNGNAVELSTSNGARKGMNYLSLDGLAVSDPVNPQLGVSSIAVSPDSIQTIHLITSGAKAEYGRSAGAQLGMVSRIGSKSWHGSAYDYIGNKLLNANDFFNNAAGIDRSNFRRNIFGGTVSGPLMSTRTLIFGSYEGNRMASQITRNRLVLMDDSDDDNDIDEDDIINDYDDDADGDGIENINDDDVDGDGIDNDNDLQSYDLENDEAKAGVFRWRTPGAVAIQSFDIAANDPKHLGIDPQIAEALAALPSPNNTLIGDGLNTGGFLYNSPTHNHADQMTARIDHTLNDNHRIYLRFNWSRNVATDIWNNADAPYPDTPEGTIENHTWGIAAGSYFTINPRMVNELRIGYVHSKTELNRPARSSQSMLLANSWTNPLNPDSPRAYISPFFEISDSLAHSRERHIFRYGATLRRTVQKSVDYAGAYPDITFGNSMGNSPAIGPMGNDVISDEDRLTFENLYNDLLGRVENVNQTYYFDLTSPLPSGTARERSFASFEYSAFIQDDWRILPNLTLNIGLRYEFLSVPHEQNDLQRVLDPSADISATANISDFNITSGDGWRNRNLANFAPRVGFAWDISRYGTFVLRGSYGIYYDRPIGAITSFLDANTYGFSQTISTHPNLGGNDIRLSEEFPYPSAPEEAPDLTLPSTRSASVAVLDPNLRTPRVDRFNLTLEYRMSDHLVFDVGYVGARGRRLYQNLDYNQTKIQGDFLQAFKEIQAYRDIGTPVPESNTLLQLFGSPINVLNALGGYYFDTGQPGVTADIMDRGYYQLYDAAGVSDFYIRNYPQFDRFIVGTDKGRSWYDSLQAGFRANSGSFRMRAYYTWGKSLDTLSADGAEFLSSSDSMNPLLNKAPSDFDRKHIINVTNSFNVPIGRNRRYGSESSRVFDWIFGDWEVGILSVWQSGQRFSVSSGRQTVFENVTSLADYDGSRNIGELHYQPANVYWFDPDQMEAFTYPEAGEMGSSGRNAFKGPKYFNVDMAFFKPFHIGNNNRLQVRAEVYNLFNRPNFGTPNADISQSEFGTITSTAGTPRMIQVALRYEF
jgi:hypothetical protein